MTSPIPPTSSNLKTLPPIGSYDEAVAFLDGLDVSIHKLGLSRIQALMASLKNPQDRYPTIHIAGSNGKGSVSAILTSILHTAGYTVGTYTSPHLSHVRERIAINGNPILADDFQREVAALKQHLEADGLPQAEWPTYFEFITACAFQHFIHCPNGKAPQTNQPVDIAIIEVGLGGRLDATNVIAAPNLSIITGITLEHTHILGDTLAAIAAEKAGIIKPGCPVVIGAQLTKSSKYQEALTTIQDMAHRCQAPVTLSDAQSLQLQTSTLSGGLSLSDTRNGHRYQLGLLGLYQKENLATVLSAIDVLRQQGFVISQESIEKGLSQSHWTARFQHFATEALILDGSHNPQGFNALQESLSHYLPTQPIVWLLSLQQTRDIAPLIDLAIQWPSTQAIIWTRPDDDADKFHTPQSAAERTQKALTVSGNTAIKVIPAGSLHDGIQQLKALQANTSNTYCVITGSLYTAGALLNQKLLS